MPEQLTREAILALPAGREMDAEVATRVMGIPAREVRARGSDETVTVWTDNPAIADGQWSARELRGWYGAPPEYSTDIAEAWRVVEFESSLRRSLNPVRLSQTLKGWCCRIRTDYYKHVVADGETPMVAICRAALLTTLD